MVRVCPEHDAQCPHGDDCPYWIDRSSCRPEGMQLKPGWLARDVERASKRAAELRSRDQPQASSPMPGAEPVAWSYELATYYNKKDGSYSEWKWRLSEDEPNISPGSIRNLTPLYPAIDPFPDDAELVRNLSEKPTVTLPEDVPLETVAAIRRLFIERQQAAGRLATLSADVAAKQHGWDEAEAKIAEINTARIAAENEAIRVRAQRDAALAIADNVLAIIHGHGGHYQVEHGRQTTIEDAHQKGAKVMSQRNAALEGINNPRDLRDQFAGQALVGMLAHSTRYRPRPHAPPDWHEAIAEEAYEIADAMLAMRVITQEEDDG